MGYRLRLDYNNTLFFTLYLIVIGIIRDYHNIYKIIFKRAEKSCFRWTYGLDNTYGIDNRNALLSKIYLPVTGQV